MKDPIKENAPQRFALYGGAFDPVHCAHLRVARIALEQAKLDQVIFIPAAQSPLKAHAPMSNSVARVEMLRLALDGETGFELDLYEIERGGLSYTIDTVRHFIACHAGAELFWIIGADQFEQLDRWRQIDELVDLVTFLVLERPGSDLKCSMTSSRFSYEVLDSPLMNESSSEIRERCEAGYSLEGLVPGAIQAFISERELYRNLL